MPKVVVMLQTKAKRRKGEINTTKNDVRWLILGAPPSTIYKTETNVTFSLLISAKPFQNLPYLPGTKMHRTELTELRNDGQLKTLNASWYRQPYLNIKSILTGGT